MLLTLDQTLAVFLFNTYEYETCSSYIGRKYMGHWQQRAVDAVFGKDHCLDSIIQYLEIK
jgi:hypothetical protein